MSRLIHRTADFAEERARGSEAALHPGGLQGLEVGLGTGLMLGFGEGVGEGEGDRDGEADGYGQGCVDESQNYN